ncbi:MAG: glucosaminidase domain-containing protein [Gammaproteobacteria bacterium]
METPAAGGFVNFSRFNGLRETLTSDSEAALARAADEFEAMFVEMMLKSAREAQMGEGLFDSQAGDTYREMFDQQLSLSLATVKSTTPSVLPPGVASPASEASGVATVAASAAERRQAFADSLWPHASKAADALGVTPRAILAQAALETGWGEHVIHFPDGRSSHNYFGIKAGADWGGRVVNVPTTEFIDGRATTISAAFRAYDRPAAAFDDYVALLSSRARYAGVRDSGSDIAQFARGLAEAGYATDPRYAEKIIAIAETTGWPLGNPSTSRL